MKTIELCQYPGCYKLTTQNGYGFICMDNVQILNISQNTTEKRRIFILKATDKNPKKAGWKKIKVGILKTVSAYNQHQQCCFDVNGAQTGYVTLYSKFANFCAPFEGKTVWVKIEEKI